MIFFFNDTATTEIYTLSLHDALPICFRVPHPARQVDGVALHPHGKAIRRQAEALQLVLQGLGSRRRIDRKSTRLNSSHANISYAVFCLKKKKQIARPYLLHINDNLHA